MAVRGEQEFPKRGTLPGTRPSYNRERMKIPAVALLLIATAAVLLFACKGAEEETPALTSGIEGQVLLGPMCPVVQQGTPCPDKPYQATIVVWNADQTKEVVTIETKSDGRFRIPLTPGEYYVDPQPPDSGGPPTPIPQTVTVAADRFAQITVQYDSGIR